MQPFSTEERDAASAVASLGEIDMAQSNDNSKKRNRSDAGFTAGSVVGPGPSPSFPMQRQHNVHQNKALRLSVEQTSIMPVIGGPKVPPRLKEPPKTLGPFPFFYYKDYSSETDPDPLTPLTSPGRVPNFPAKMHSILSRPDLADVVAWMPHGRSWRVLKPREFEIRVIPTYFEHAKFSSFIRQANGWGFRRITQGRDRNSYYHELFLRGLPHLCKKMKRPGVAEKRAADPEHEPDFYKISELHPVPEKADDESILLQCTLKGGPKARMPICAAGTMLPTPGTINGDMSMGHGTMPLHHHHLAYASASAPTDPTRAATPSTATAAHQHPTIGTPKLTPKDQFSLNAFQQSISASENQLGTSPPQQRQAGQHQQQHHSQNAAVATGIPRPSIFGGAGAAPSAAPAISFIPHAPNNSNKSLAALAAANQLALTMPSPPTAAAATATTSVASTAPLPTATDPQIAAAINASTAASQFAAGFAAATAINQQQFRNILGSIAVAGQQAQVAAPTTTQHTTPVSAAAASPFGHHHPHGHHVHTHTHNPFA